MRSCGSDSSEPSTTRPRMLMRIRQYDETPVKLRVAHEEDGDVIQDQQTCKLLVIEQKAAALVVSTDAQKTKGFCMETLVPSQLFVIASNTGELIAEALYRCNNAMPASTAYERALDIVTTDSYGANFLAERYLEQCRDPCQPTGRLHLTCTVHRLHSCAGSVFNLFDGMTAGLIKTALALRSGFMHSFRSALKQVLSERLKVYRGQEPVHLGGPGFQEYKNFVVSTFYDSRADAAVIVELYNGDWTVGHEVSHYCNGCCSSEMETLQKFIHYTKRLCKKGPPVFPRHKWIGAHDSINWFARFTLMHNLLPHILAKMWGKQQSSETSAAGTLVQQDNADRQIESDLQTIQPTMEVDWKEAGHLAMPH